MNNVPINIHLESMLKAYYLGSNKDEIKRIIGSIKKLSLDINNDYLIIQWYWEKYWIDKPKDRILIIEYIIPKYKWTKDPFLLPLIFNKILETWIESIRMWYDYVEKYIDTIKFLIDNGNLIESNKTLCKVIDIIYAILTPVTAEFYSKIDLIPWMDFDFMISIIEFLHSTNDEKVIQYIWLKINGDYSKSNYNSLEKKYILMLSLSIKVKYNLNITWILNWLKNYKEEWFISIYQIIYFYLYVLNKLLRNEVNTITRSDIDQIIKIYGYQVSCTIFITLSMILSDLWDEYNKKSLVTWLIAEEYESESNKSMFCKRYLLSYVLPKNSLYHESIALLSHLKNVMIRKNLLTDKNKEELLWYYNNIPPDIIIYHKNHSWEVRTWHEIRSELINWKD